MSISLKKNEGISLSKTTNAPLETIVMGLGWDAFVIKEEKVGGFFGFGKSKVGQVKKIPMDVDLDASCLLLDGSGQVIDVIYFGSPELRSRCGNVIHTGDNQTGDGDGDDEQIKVNLAKLSPNIKHVVFTVNAYTSSVSFNNVENAFCRIFNDADGKEMVRTELDASGNHNAIVMAEIRKVNGEWEFKSLLEPCSGRTAKQIAPVVQNLVAG